MDAKKIFLFFVCIISTIIILDLFFQKKSDPIIGIVTPAPDIIGMPIVRDTDPKTIGLFWGRPQEDRSSEYFKYLASSVKISVRGGSGSGTITYYDPTTKEAYVTSCGHLWSGTRVADELKSNPISCQVTIWYQNQTKLPTPQEYPAQVLFWSNKRGYDSSLIKFKPDWIPEFYPIAPIDYQIVPGSHYNSCGCDGGREVARYDVEIVGYRDNDLITTKNSPRPGRSGGGLLSEDGYYIATCWGTSDTSGEGGIGYFTPLKSIHQVYGNNGYGWLCNIQQILARKIPIIDQNNPQQKYPNDYVPIPKSDSIIIPR